MQPEVLLLSQDHMRTLKWGLVVTPDTFMGAANMTTDFCSGSTVCMSSLSAPQTLWLDNQSVSSVWLSFSFFFLFFVIVQ